MAHQNRSSFHQCQEVEESDPYVNAPGIEGVGEIGITGTADAVANAVGMPQEFACANSRLRWIN